jgi:hypothetical protein
MAQVLGFPDSSETADLSSAAEITKFASEGIITLPQTESRLIFSAQSGLIYRLIAREPWQAKDSSPQFFHESFASGKWTIGKDS